MGLFTTQKNDTLVDKAKKTVKGKAAGAVDAVKPSTIRAKRHEEKGGAFCIGCGKPITGRKAHQANVHPRAKCQRAAAERMGSVMDRSW